VTTHDTATSQTPAPERAANRFPSTFPHNSRTEQRQADGDRVIGLRWIVTPSAPSLSLEAIFEHSADGVLATDRHGHRVYSNPSLDSMVGTDARLPLHTATPPPYVPPDQHHEYCLVLKATRQVLEGLASVSASLELLNWKLGRFPVRLNVAAFSARDASTMAVWLIQAERREGGPASPLQAEGLMASRPASQRDRIGPDMTDLAPELRALTPRECEIVRMLLDGGRVNSIASALFVSQHTVRNHLKAIFRKLGVHSQMELIERFKHRGFGG
jgi:DNA-binding CsgD family transcriptional regulator